jgi:hypothetical protein
MFALQKEEGEGVAPILRPYNVTLWLSLTSGHLQCDEGRWRYRDREAEVLNAGHDFMCFVNEQYATVNPMDATKLRSK